MLGMTRTWVLSGVLLLALVGCERDEGPAEEAGEEIDQAIESAGEKMEEAGDKLRERTDN